MTPNVLFDLLRTALDRNALGHAVLLVDRGRMLESNAQDVARFQATILCIDGKAGASACGQCASCRLVLREGEGAPHPDFVQLRADDKSAYSVEDARGILDSFSRSRALSPRRLAWISDADLLVGNGQGLAANALLKALEEPRPESFWVLTTARPDALLATIRSRCHTFRLSGAATLPPLERDWQPLTAWMMAGAPEGRGPMLPPDEEAFWKDRESALGELREVFPLLWETIRAGWPNLGADVDGGRRILDTFQALEACIGAVAGYGNAPLQWARFRWDAKLDKSP